MTHRDEAALPAERLDQWSGEFEADPLDSLQEEHHAAVAHEELILVPGAPSGATKPYEGLLADLPEEEEREPLPALPTPQTITGRLSQVTVRNYYDDPLPLAEASTQEEEEADGGFVLTRERVEEFQLPLPKAKPQAASAASKRSNRSRFITEETLPAFPEASPETDEARPEFSDDAATAAEEFFGLRLPSGQTLDPEDVGIDPNFRSMEVESAFAFAEVEDDVRVKWEIPAEIQAIVGEETSKGTSLDEIREMIREELADLKALAAPVPKRSPSEPYSDDELDRIILATIPKAAPEWAQPIEPPPVPEAQPVPPKSVPAAPVPAPAYSRPVERERSPLPKIPWVKVLIVAALFYFFDWPDALSLTLIFGAVWAVWLVAVATLRWLRYAGKHAHIRLRTLTRS